MKPNAALLALSALAFSPTASAGQLDWLVGCWESPDRTAKEVWVREQDGSLSGFSVAIDGNEIAFYEVLRITVAPGGTVSYTAHPVGQPAATFKAKNVSGTIATFSNPSHDYPQKISYERDGDNLYATISTIDGENAQAFNKKSCD